MGRDYWHWCSSAPTTNTKNAPSSSSKASATTSAGGCISSLFNFLDFRFPHLYSNHHFIPNLHHHQHQPIQKVVQKGLEAPRNSLESEEDMKIASSRCKQDEILNIRPIINRIKTSRVDTKPTTATIPNDCSSDNSSSSPASVKTPSLVARLMGLDPLPYCDSPSSKSSSASAKPFRIGSRNSFEGTRSLPETPRISLARRSVDSDCYNHRLSLQINKENNVSGDSKSPSFYARQIVSQVKDRVDNRLSVQIRKENVAAAANGGGGDQNRSPRYYARQIYSQVKDRVGRSKTLTPLTDVTNTRAENPDHQKATRSMTRSNCTTVMKRNTTRLQVQSVKEEAEQQQQAKKCKTGTVPNNRSKIITATSYDHDILRRDKQEEPFVPPAGKSNLLVLLQEKKINGKKTPLGSQLATAASVITVPVKKDPSPPDIKIPQKQINIPDTQKSKRRSSFSQLPATSSQRYKQEATGQPAPRSARYVTNGSEAAAENEYVNSILRRIGISKDRPVSSTMWFSPAHPLNPSIFFYLEHCCTAARTGGLDSRSNRKLLFQLVDEILVEILKPHLKMKPWIIKHERFAEMKGGQLGETLIAKIGRFPRADCRVLEDIDALVETDLQIGTAPYEEEGEGIVTEIEKDVVDTLILETTAYLLWGV